MIYLFIAYNIFVWALGNSRRLMIFDVMERNDLLPIVIREGNPWGLKIISGVIPDSVNGMFSIGHFWLQEKGKRNRKIRRTNQSGFKK